MDEDVHLAAGIRDNVIVRLLSRAADSKNRATLVKRGVKFLEHCAEHVVLAAIDRLERTGQITRVPHTSFILYQMPGD